MIDGAMKNKLRHDLSIILGSYQALAESAADAMDRNARDMFQESNRRLNEILIALDTKSVPGKRLIFLQFAMRLEANPLIQKLNAKKVENGFAWASGLPFEFYRAKLSSADLLIGMAGVDPVHAVDSIGSVPAAVLAELTIRHVKPSLIINAGTCGGFQSRGHEIAQVFVGTKYVAFHHRRSTIPAMRAYGIGKYPVTDTTSLRSALNLPEGVVTSGDALDYSKEDEEYIASNGGTLKEMEAAAIGWIADFHRLPLLPLKTVTDWVDHPSDTAEQFMANYARSVENLSDALLKVLTYLDTHPKDAAWG